MMLTSMDSPATLRQECRGVGRSLRRWLRDLLDDHAPPEVDPALAERLRVAHLAVDVAEALKRNPSERNRAVIEKAAELLGTDE